MSTNQCKSCVALMINGVYCHEAGCPDAWADYENECFECGSLFKPDYEGQRYCDEACAGLMTYDDAAYNEGMTE